VRWNLYHESTKFRKHEKPKNFVLFPFRVSPVSCFRGKGSNVINQELFFFTIEGG
jgi:hypothetical protein